MKNNFSIICYLENIQKMKPQFILRYGATFPDKELEQKNILTGKKDKINKLFHIKLLYNNLMNCWIFTFVSSNLP